MRYSACKLNKQGDNIQPWRTPFPIRNQSVVPCLVLTVASWATYRFLRRQVRWSSIPNSLRIFNEADFSWNSLAFSVIQRMLPIWFLVPLSLLNPACPFRSSWRGRCWSLVWGILSALACEMRATVPSCERSLASPFFGPKMKTDLLRSCGHWWVFQICWHTQCSTLTASPFRILNSSAGIL